jgi:hypothetical protein
MAKLFNSGKRQLALHDKVELHAEGVSLQRPLVAVAAATTLGMRTAQNQTSTGFYPSTSSVPRVSANNEAYNTFGVTTMQPTGCPGSAATPTVARDDRFSKLSARRRNVGLGAIKAP